MKLKATLLFISCILSFSSYAQEETMPLDTAGFQIYVMGEGDEATILKQYFMCFLKKGPNREHDEETAQAIQAAHMANIGKLAEMGKIHIAGPFGDDGDLRGIFIYNVRTMEEAERLAKSDPAVMAGRLTYEIIPWWGAMGSTLK